MQVVKWRDTLAVALPSEVVERLDLHEGDDIEFEVKGDRVVMVETRLTREEALDEIRALRRPLPASWTWDREEANARG